jgi:hypothetical protein
MAGRARNGLRGRIVHPFVPGMERRLATVTEMRLGVQLEVECSTTSGPYLTGRKFVFERR